MSKKKKFLQSQNNPGGLIRRTEGVYYSGPLPPAQELQRYNDILPGAADRIITMAEQQSYHRQSLESKVITSDTRNATVGLFFGFIIGLTGIIAGTVLIFKNHVLPGSFISGGTIVSLVSTFVYGSQKRKKEREKKLQ